MARIPTTGDRVLFKAHPDRPTGKIIFTDYMTDEVVVEWDDVKLIPHVQNFPMKSCQDGTLVLYGPEQKLNLSKCECGVSIAMGKQDDPMFHSDWCPIKERI